MFKFRLAAVTMVLLLLAACSFMRPSETAMKTAIANYVLQEKDYPQAFIQPENFVFNNLVKVVDSDPAQYRVDAEFDFTYTADGDVIVQALDLKRDQEREIEKRKTDNPLEEIKGAVKGALENFRYESRFKNVRTGDQDHFKGNFTLTRNADNSWRVSEARYE